MGVLIALTWSASMASVQETSTVDGAAFTANGGVPAILLYGTTTLIVTAPGGSITVGAPGQHAIAILGEWWILAEADANFHGRPTSETVFCMTMDKTELPKGIDLHDLDIWIGARWF